MKSLINLIQPHDEIEHFNSSEDPSLSLSKMTTGLTFMEISSLFSLYLHHMSMHTSKYYGLVSLVLGTFFAQHYACVFHPWFYFQLCVHFSVLYIMPLFKYMPFNFPFH